jgi:hypothetical protein
MALKKPSAMADCGAGMDVSTPETVVPGSPLLSEFIASPRYGDGTRRELPTLNLFLHDGRLTAALNDRDNQRTAFVSGVSLADVLGALETGLAEDSLGWRPNKPSGGKKR